MVRLPVHPTTGRGLEALGCTRYMSVSMVLGITLTARAAGRMASARMSVATITSVARPQMSIALYGDCKARAQALASLERGR